MRLRAPPLLSQVLRLADRLRAEPALHAVGKLLSEGGALNWEAALDVLSMPCLEGAAYEPALRAAAAAALQVRGCGPAAGAFAAG